jgi:hypothetical protein
MRRPEEAAVILLRGRELGLAPMQSLQAIHVVQGRPVLSADLMVALVRRSGLCASWRTVESTPETCTIETMRVDEQQPTRKTWTMADATRAGLGPSKGGNWRAYPAQMLRHRCASDLAREVYPDVVLGCYTRDEVESPGPSEIPVAPVVDAPAPVVATRAVPASITAATTCERAATSYRGEVDGTDPSDPEVSRYHSECRAAAVAAVRAIGLPVAASGLAIVATSPGLAALCDAAMGVDADALPAWWRERAAQLDALPDDWRQLLSTACARLWQGIEAGDPRTAETLRLWDAAIARPREPGDDDDTPPTAPQGPTRGRRTTVTAQGTGAASQGADGAVAWAESEASVQAHASGWAHARHVEASVRRHAGGLTAVQADWLLRAAVGRLEALASADADGTRPTAEGLRRLVARWAAEGPVAARRAA